MFLQFSPVRPKKLKKIEQKEKNEVIEVLSLAPFAPNPKLYFDRVEIGKNATCKLRVLNPTKQDINIYLTRKLPEELNVNYSWENKTIEKGCDELFEITWKPTNQEASYHKITFEGSKIKSRDIHIVFKTLSPKKVKCNKKSKNVIRKSPQKSPTKKYYSTKPPHISTKKYSPSPKKIYHHTAPTTNQLNIEQIDDKRGTYNFNNGNYRHQLLSYPQISTPLQSYTHDSPNVSLATYYKQTVCRTETKYLGVRYTQTKDSNTVLNKLEENLTEKFNDSLEFEPPQSSSEVCTPRFKIRKPLKNYNASVEMGVSEKIYFKDPFNLDIQHEHNRGKENYLEEKIDYLSPRDFVTQPRLGMYNVSPQDISLGSYFRQKSCKPETPINNEFEYKLKHLQSFCFTPNEKSQNVEDCTLKVEQNASSETYMKDNSFDTYIKGNISGGTYTIDSSPGDVKRLSPLATKISQVPLRTLLPDIDNLKTNNISFVNDERHALSAIQEESFVHNKTAIRKKCDIDLNVDHARAGGGLTGPQDWSKRGGAAFRISKNTSGLKLAKVTDSISERSQVSHTHSHTFTVQNPFLLSVTDMVDPFMTNQLYVSPEWMDQQEKDFKKWLNSLLAPPEELRSEAVSVDVAKVWQECKKREVEGISSKEEISNKYHVNAKLNSLRRCAQNLFVSKEIRDVLSKVLLAIDKGKISIRQDKDVHLNIAIKSQVMSFILSYNPLWLRIGLETVYNETIPLRSNSDIIGLTTFLLNRLFKDPYLVKKFKSVHAPKYAEAFNKVFLKKFFSLVYILDQAKNKKLIPHDPCLFCKTGAVKESRELLLMLAREVISAVGDITKFLKLSGYVVTHVQTYIHEFDYVVKNLGADLRDGVRLTKIMEIILLRTDLTSNLRVPTVSRLQKVHNMKIVFSSLEEAGFKILYDISPKDIVDGHREKTLSFLWQIIHKFEAPLMVKSATTIQTWFRSLPTVLKRQQLRKLRSAKENAATKIQMWYKNQILSKKLFIFAKLLKNHLYQLKLERSSIKIQSFYKMYKQKKIYNQQLTAVKEIQRLARGWLVRNSYIHRINSAILLQRNIRMFLAKKSYLKIKNATLKIQRWHRSIKETKLAVENYQRLKIAVKFIENRYHARQLMNEAKLNYRNIRASARTIQIHFRAYLAMKQCRNEYHQLKSTVIFIQTIFRANRAMKLERTRFLELKTVTVMIQSRFRANRKMLIACKSYLSIRNAVLKIQRWYRSIKETKLAVENYQRLKTAVNIIENRYQARQLMNEAQLNYRNTRAATRTIQIHFRAYLAMQQCRYKYLQLKSTVIFIQTIFRANRAMKLERIRYLKLKAATIVVQNQFRAIQRMRECKNYFESLKTASLIIQRRYRANMLMKTTRKQYQELLKSTVTLQRLVRAKLAMIKHRNIYVQIKKAAIQIQVRWRASKKSKEQRHYYVSLKLSVTFVQQCWRSKISSRLQRNRYLELKRSAILIQRKWRAILEFRKTLQEYKSLKEATIYVQRKWRAKKTRNNYERLKCATIFVQSTWRSKLLARKERQAFIELKSTVVFIQRQWRAVYAGKKTLQEYQQLKQATMLIQQRFRANKAMKADLEYYNKRKQFTLIIQMRFRAKKEMRIQRNKYMAIRTATIKIQTWLRRVLKARKVRTVYLAKINAVREIQKFAKGYLIRKKYAEYFTEEAREQRRIEKLRNVAATKIQAFWRGHMSRSAENPNLKTIRERYHKALAVAAPEQTLGVKSDYGVQTLVNKNSTLFQIIKALEDIDFATRRCKIICMRLGEILSEPLYVLISSMGRSLPETTASTLSVNILINFNKLEETKQHSFKGELVENLIMVMIHFCDKDSHLFPSLCTLIWLFAKTPRWKRRLLGLPNINQKLEKIRGLVMRKESMVKKQGVKGFSLFSSYRNLPLPSPVPDWGLDYKDNPYKFTNSVQAFTALSNILF